MRGISPGPSAGGEQLKFTAYHAPKGHVIVKFTPNQAGPVARRWRDILITEFHATKAVHEAGVPAAETRLLEIGNRLFLESRPFDRSGGYGRMPTLSLQAIDTEFTGLGANWPQVMRALSEPGLVKPRHVYNAECLYVFGRLINNTDMHLGNLSLSIDGQGFSLLPAYHIGSMRFAPRAGDVPPFSFSPPSLRNAPARDVRAIDPMAHRFWETVHSDRRISNEFRSFLENGNRP